MAETSNNIESVNSVRGVITFAARSGIPMGLYLTAVAACVIFSLHIDSLALIATILMLGIPVLLSRLITPLASADVGGKPAGVGTLWLGGIYCFLFAALICGLLSGLYLTFFEPSFLSEYLRKGIESVRLAGNPPGLAEQADLMQRAIDSRMIPSSMELVVSMIWATGFFGSILSLIVAAFVTLRHRRRNFNNL